MQLDNKRENVADTTILFPLDCLLYNVDHV